MSNTLSAQAGGAKLEEFTTRYGQIWVGLSERWLEPRHLEEKKER